MKKTLALLTALLLLLSLAGCGRYVSGYKAVGFVHSNSSASASMSFLSFEGRMVFRLKSPAEGELKYEAKLESGKAAVYYDFHGTKQELFTISGGEETASRGGYVESGTVYVIVETDGTCQNGEFRFGVDE